MRYFFLYIISCALPLNCLFTQEQLNTEKVADSGSINTSVKTDSSPKSLAVNSKTTNNILSRPGKTISRRNNEKSTKEIFDELNAIMGRIEILNKPSKGDFIDTNHYTAAYLPPEKPKAVIRLRIVNIDSTSNTPLECKLIIDSVGYSAMYLKKMRDSVKYIDASLRANSNELLIKLRGFNNSYPTKMNLNNTVKSEDAFYRNTTYFLIILAGLVIILWAIYRLVRSYSGKTPASKDAPLAAQSGNEELSEALIAKETSLPEILYMPAVQNVRNISSRYFLSEIMITAGPRKRFMGEPDADKDLGEDVCGFVSNNSTLLLWLLDGTSDQYCLKNPDNNREYFSSRLLAQSIANKMRSAFTKIGNTGIDELVNQAIKQVKSDWLRTISKLPVQEKNVLTANIESKNFPECSTTLFFAHLSINGELTVYRSGDSKMFLYRTLEDGKNNYIETPLAAKPEKSNDRLFFRLVLNSDGDITILHNSPRFEVINQEKVHTLVAFSDGVGAETETLLKQTIKNSLDDIRSELIYQVQGTADDKSICFVEIREENENVQE